MLLGARGFFQRCYPQRSFVLLGARNFSILSEIGGEGRGGGHHFVGALRVFRENVMAMQSLRFARAR